MKPLHSLLLLTLPLAASGLIGAAPLNDPAASKCAPAANEVAVFAEARYAGACRLLKPGVHATPAAIGLGPAGVGSVRVPNRMRAQLCGFDRSGRVQCRSPWHDDDRIGLSGFAPVSFVKVLDESRPRENCELGGSAADGLKVALQAVIGGAGSDVTLCLKLPMQDYPNAAAMGLIDPPTLSGVDPKVLERLRASGQYAAASDVKRVMPGRRAVVRLCTKPDFGGDCRDLRFDFSFGQSAPPFASMRVGADWGCRLGASAQALLYAEDAAWGRCSRLDTGDYPTKTSLRLEGAPARTLKLAKDTTATVCSAENLQGDCRELPPGATIDGADVQSLQLRLVAPNPAPAASASGT